MATPYSSIAALLLILIQFTTLPNSCLATRKILTTEKTNTEFIRTSCVTTSYPNLCLTTFSAYASKVQSSPKLLASTALTVTLNITSSTSKSLVKLSKTKGLNPKETAALGDCVQQLEGSVDGLKRSIGEMGSDGKGKSFELRMSDIKTWVSAALTNEETCMDDFSGKVLDGNVKPTVTRQIEKVEQMTSIALAFVNRYAATNKS